jgi:hypothetical protein
MLNYLFAKDVVVGLNAIRKTSARAIAAVFNCMSWNENLLP